MTEEGYAPASIKRKLDMVSKALRMAAEEYEDADGNPLTHDAPHQGPEREEPPVGALPHVRPASSSTPAFAGAKRSCWAPKCRAGRRRRNRDALSINEVAAAFGLRFAMPDYLIELYKSLKNDLPAFNVDPSWTLPMPARYVIGQDGTILYAEVNPDYTRRPEPEDMLPALRRASAVAA